MTQLRIGIVGAAGRMGKMNIAEVLENPNVKLSAALERRGSEFNGLDAGLIATGKASNIYITENIEQFIADSDAVIDFSTPASTLTLAEKVAKTGKVHIIGTTGLTKEEEEKLNQYAKNCRIVYAPNMSLGVNLLFSLVKKVAASLDENYDIEIVEMHHNKKVDSPSGTALGLGKAAAAGRNVNLDDVWCKERNGNIGARKKGEIGFATLRGGDVIGDHTVIFAAAGERLELTHKASDRRLFTNGALKCAIWAAKQQNGFYSMQNVLGF
ncbi:MAG TPA: 4-hydroxy-tetrahydrodipicolinate reductase [Alphaproteobacteria bacterium]|nr:4-hydroxy-tetrahydrodipicolinate reductase [Alphaproteobacteria bacterium]